VKTFETVRVAKGGRAIDVSATISPIRDHDGRIVGASTILRDIRELKRVSGELFATYQRFQALMQALPVGVTFSEDPNCFHITGNRAALVQFEVLSDANLSASAPDGSAAGR